MRGRIILTTLFVIGSWLAAGAREARAQFVPPGWAITAQLEEDGVAMEGTHDFAVQIWNDPSAGTSVFASSIGPQPVSAGFVAFDVASLGLPAVLDASTSFLFLELSVDGVALSPRVKIESVPWATRAAGALDAKNLAGLPDTSWQRRVTGACSAGQAMTGVKADGTVFCGAVGGTYGAGSGLQLVANVFSVAPLGIVAGHIADGAVGTAKLAVGAVGSAQILDGSVAAVDLGANSVTSAKIQDSTIVSADILDSTITSADIANATITNADLAANSVTDAEVVDGTIGSADLGVGAAKMEEVALPMASHSSGNLTANCPGACSRNNFPMTAVTMPASGQCLVIGRIDVLGHASDPEIGMSVIFSENGGPTLATESLTGVDGASVGEVSVIIPVVSGRTYRFGCSASFPMGTINWDCRIIYLCQ